MRMLVADALSEGKPAHEALAQAGLGPSIIGLHFKAGRLEQALKTAGFADDQVRLAREWPAAFRAANSGLSNLQPHLPRALPLAATTAMLAAFAMVQKFVGGLIRLKVEPLLQEIATTTGGATPPAGTPEVDAFLWLGGGLAVVALLVGGFSVARRMGPLATRSDEEDIVRQAVFASALQLTQAPLESRRRVLSTAQDLTTALPDELDVIRRHALARWSRREAHLLLFVRTVGYLGLSIYAGALCVRVYVTLALLAGMS